MREIDVRCAVCGALGRKAELTSTSSFGPRDLDLRPAPPARWALEFQVQRCDDCGYCARTIGQATPTAAATVESPVYRGVLRRSRLPRLARSLFCAALACEAADDPEGAGWRFLEAAWVCDDRKAREQARTCRERAAEMLTRAIDVGETETEPFVLRTVTADAWRRARRFDEALAACDEVDRSLAEAVDEDGEGVAVVIGFIRELALEEDDTSRNVAEAFAREE